MANSKLQENGKLRDRIEAFHSDCSWIENIRTFFDLDEATVGEFIACFFKERIGDNIPVPIPNWAHMSTGPDYDQAKREVCMRRNWTRESVGDLMSMIHLEIMGREGYKKVLHAEWLLQLEGSIIEGAPFKILDFGSGVSSFSELALNYPESACELVDVDGIDYLRYRYARWAGRVKVTKLDVFPGSIYPRARVRENFKPIVGRFDAIVLADVLEHTLNPFALLLHLYRQTKIGGLLFINYPNEIEGIWHTPEANYLRRWCYRFLRLSCFKVGGYTWKKRGFPRNSLLPLLADLSESVLSSRARKFSKNYFISNGEAIVDLVRSRDMEVSVEALIRSVDK